MKEISPQHKLICQLSLAGVCMHELAELFSMSYEGARDIVKRNEGSPTDIKHYRMDTIRRMKSEGIPVHEILKKVHLIDLTLSQGYN